MGLEVVSPGLRVCRCLCHRERRRVVVRLKRSTGELAEILKAHDQLRRLVPAS